MTQRMRRRRNYLAVRPDRTPAMFGVVVAENDADLAEYYIGRERFLSRALDSRDRTSVFLGPKGVGKSAVLQMVRHERGRDLRRLIEISPDDLASASIANVQAQTKLLNDATRNQFLFKTLWAYVFAIEVMQREYMSRGAVRNAVNNIFGSRAAKNAKRLVDMTMTDEGHPRDFTAKILDLVNEIELRGEGGGAAVQATARLNKTDALAGKQLEMLQLINRVAKALPQLIEHEYFILIDDLDLHWTDAPIQNAFIGALFLAMRILSCERIKFVVSLRDNIFERIPIEDKDKLRDYICQIDWSEKAIKQMLQARVSYVFSTNQSEVWSNVFPLGDFQQFTPIHAACHAKRFGCPRSRWRLRSPTTI